MPNVLRPKPTQWTVLSSGVRPPQMLSWSTTLEINDTTNRTSIKSTLIDYHLQYIIQWYMTMAYLSPSITGTFQSSANLILRELESKNPAQATIPSYGLALSWTSRLTLPLRLTTSSCSTMVLRNPSKLGTCLRSFPNHQRHPTNPPCHTFFLRFFMSTPRLRWTMTYDITRGISPNRPTAFTTSATSLTSTRSNLIGAFLYQIFLQHGRTCAPRASSTPTTLSAAFFGTHLHPRGIHHQLRQTSSALQAFSVNAHVHYSLRLLLRIQTEKHGYSAFTKKRMASDHKTLTMSSTWRNIVPSVLKVPPGYSYHVCSDLKARRDAPASPCQSPYCDPWQSRRPHMVKIRQICTSPSS